MPLVYNPRTGLFEEKRYQNPPKITNVHIVGDRTVLVGDIYTVRWELEDAENLKIDGQNVDLTQTSKTFSALTDGTITHQLVASNDCGAVERAISVRLFAKPVISLNATKLKLRDGSNETTTIEWNVQNAHSVSFVKDGISSAVGQYGSHKVSPSRTTSYKIIATALNGTTTVEKEITIGVFPVAKVEFNSNREFSLPKIPIVLSWDIQNAVSVELVGFGSQTLRGNLIVRPKVV